MCNICKLNNCKHCNNCYGITIICENRTMNACTCVGYFNNNDFYSYKIPNIKLASGVSKRSSKLESMYNNRVTNIEFHQEMHIDL